MINRYPLMDVSTAHSFTFYVALCQEEYLLCDYQSPPAIFPLRLPLHARLIFVARRGVRPGDPYAALSKPNFHLQAEQGSRR